MHKYFAKTAYFKTHLQDWENLLWDSHTVYQQRLQFFTIRNVSNSATNMKMDGGHSLPGLDSGRTADVESSSVTAKGIISWQSLAHLSMSDFLPDWATISRAGIPQHGAWVRGSTITTVGWGWTCSFDPPLQSTLAYHFITSETGPLASVYLCLSHARTAKRNNTHARTHATRPGTARWLGTAQSITLFIVAICCSACHATSHAHHRLAALFAGRTKEPLWRQIVAIHAPYSNSDTQKKRWRIDCPRIRQAAINSHRHALIMALWGAHRNTDTWIIDWRSIGGNQSWPRVSRPWQQRTRSHETRPRCHPTIRTSLSSVWFPCVFSSLISSNDTYFLIHMRFLNQCFINTNIFEHSGLTHILLHPWICWTHLNTQN